MLNPKVSALGEAGCPRKAFSPAHWALGLVWLLSHWLSGTVGLSWLQFPSSAVLVSEKEVCIEMSYQRNCPLQVVPPQEVSDAGSTSLLFPGNSISHPLNGHVVWDASCVVGLIRGTGTKDPALSKTNRTGKGYWKQC